MSNLPPDLPSDNISIVVDKLFPPKVRLAMYAVAFAAAVVLIVIGLIDSSTAAQWLFFAGNILGVGTSGLALLNGPRAIKE